MDQIRLDHENLNPETDLINTLESHFSVNIAIIDLCTYDIAKILCGKGPNGQKSLRFKRKPESWDNVKFFSYKDDDFYYLRYKLEEMKHCFSQNDCVLPMRIETIMINMGYDKIVELTEENIDQIETTVNCQIRIYDQRDNGQIHSVENLVHGSIINTGVNSINLVINDRKLIFQPIAVYSWLASDKFIIKNFRCETPKCSMSFERLDKYKTHVKSCQKGVKITTKQRILGDNEGLLEKAVRRGYLPENFTNFRQKYICVFDIETFEAIRSEEISPLTTIEASHKLVSLAIASNLPGYKDKFLCRESSNPESEQKLVDTFVAELETLHALLVDNIPAEVTDAIRKLDEEIQVLRFGFEKTELAGLKKFLEQYSRVNFLGTHFLGTNGIFEKNLMLTF